MKVEILVAIVLTGLSTGERRERSTFLTDESKKILEHFDFSNFDKQEALNYLDRQRYDNQIRGKRSHPKANYANAYDTESHEFLNKFSPNCDRKEPLKSLQSFKRNFNSKNLENPQFYSDPLSTHKKDAVFVRKKRYHKFKKKHKVSKSHYNESPDVMFEGEGENEVNEQGYRRRKKKKRKRHYWDRWSEWGPCSVTCGRGRKIRWRRCIAKNCLAGELEMGEKTCQLPACNLLTKLLGF